MTPVGFMSDQLPPQPVVPDAINTQACSWFALIVDGSATAEERQAWQRWMQADPRHAQAYRELERLWSLSAGLARVPVAAPASGSLSRRRFVQWASAASVGALALGSGVFWLEGRSLPWGDVRTAIGERRRARLADGTEVELAGNTAFDVDFSGQERRIRMLRGEAFFQVAVDSTRPFRVEAGAGSLSTAGADFCLSCLGDGVELSVSQHSLRVMAAGQQAELAAGQALHYSPRGLGDIQRAELEQILAWRAGRLVFFDTPLATVVSSLERWRSGRIFIADERLAARPVSLILNLQQPERMLDVLAQALPIRIQQYTPLLTLIQPA